jgi:hypothetical protein
MTVVAIGLSKDSVGVQSGSVDVQSPYGTSTTLSAGQSQILANFISQNSVVNQVGSAYPADVTEPAQVYYGSSYIDGYAQFVRDAAVVQKYKSTSAGFSIDTSKGAEKTLIFTGSASISDAITTIVDGGAIQAALLSGGYQLGAGFRLGRLASGSVTKGQSITVSAVYSGNLPSVSLAGVATAANVTYYACNAASSGGLVAYGGINALVMTKAAASSIGIVTTTAGTGHKAAAAGTWAVISTVNDVTAMTVAAEDSGAILLAMAHTF